MRIWTHDKRQQEMDGWHDRVESRRDSEKCLGFCVIRSVGQ